MLTIDLELSSMRAWSAGVIPASGIVGPSGAVLFARMANRIESPVTNGRPRPSGAQTIKEYDMKTKVIAYWVATAIIAFVMLSRGVVDLVHQKDTLEGMLHLGYPLYFMRILGVWKVLGGIAVLAPGLPRLKEWVY